MSSSEFRRWLWSVGLVLCAACAKGPGAEHDPRPSRVVPSEGVNTESVPIAIEGENFRALATQRLGGGPPVELDSRFEARLGDTPLADVVLEHDGLLRAVVPPGMAVGRHALTLVSPLGRSVVLPDAFFVWTPAELVGTLSGPERLNQGQTVTWVLELKNTGTSGARAVRPQVLESSGTERVRVVSAPAPEPVDLAGGATHSFRWTLEGVSEGQVSARLSASGTDALDGRPLSMPPLDAALEVQRPAALTSRLSAPSYVDVGTPFQVTLTVTNTGSAEALEVEPLPLDWSGSAGLVPQSLPSGQVTLGGGGSHDFQWTFSATRPGSFSLSGSARGRDANDDRALLSAPTTSSGDTRQEGVAQLAVDPLGDGTAFSFIFRYDGRVYLGPNRTGTGGARMGPDGAGLEPFTWSFPRDSVGNVTTNARPPPYPSIGAPGCVKDTYGCGPDNENGRGLFFAGVMGGQEWLGAGGANSGGDVDFVYLTQETDSQLDFRFVDLDAAPLGGQTRGTSSALFFNDRLYLGFPDTGGNRPYLVVLNRMPSMAPGFDAQPPLDAQSLDAEKMPGLGTSGTPSNPASMQMIDALAAFNDRLYVANNGGCIRSTTPTPRAYDDFPGDWAPCTPALPAWTLRASRTTSKTANLEPEDKAVPGMAVFGGRLYLARNTFAGPQLFACTPGTGGDPLACDPGDWRLVAPNTQAGRDALLTQFDNPNNASLALLVATARHLYLGFDNPVEGLVLLRSEGTGPATSADFRGTGACVAAQHPGGCAGLGGNGLGVRATRLFDGVALTFGGMDFVYLTAGDGSGAVRVFRVMD